MTKGDIFTIFVLGQINHLYYTDTEYILLQGRNVKFYRFIYSYNKSDLFDKKYLDGHHISSMRKDYFIQCLQDFNNLTDELKAELI
jgi:hypothetical protein